VRGASLTNLRRATEGCVLDAERTYTPYWDGDLMHFAIRASARPGTLAAMVVAEDGHARAWMNLRYCHEAIRTLVWLRLRRAAQRRACTVLYAEDLVPLALLAEDDLTLGC
jgi:hypothetical protein